MSKEASSEAAEDRDTRVCCSRDLSPLAQTMRRQQQVTSKKKKKKKRKKKKKQHKNKNKKQNKNKNKNKQKNKKKKTFEYKAEHDQGRSQAAEDGAVCVAAGRDLFLLAQRMRRQQQVTSTRARAPTRMATISTMSVGVRGPSSAPSTGTRAATPRTGG